MNDPTPLIVANLKANKTWEEISVWLDVVGLKANDFSGTVIFAPSYPFIAAAHQKIKSSRLRIKLASQDISRFEQGAYTGEVAASQIANLCQYAIIGHSERRQNFSENDAILAQKVQNAIHTNITVIFCVQNAQTSIPPGIKIVAYEPVFAIGTGNPDTPENAYTIAQRLKTRLARLAAKRAARQAKGDYIVIYGGSVTSENTKSFLKSGIIDGLLVATNSLNPQNFNQIIESATI